MNRLITALTLLFTATSFASNGTHGSSASAAATGLGGVSQALYTTETEALFRNPALLSSGVKETMKPRVEVTLAYAKHNSQGASASGSTTLPDYTPSNDSAHIFPMVAAGMKITEELAAGLGLVSVGGSSIDYTGNSSLTEQKGEQFTYRLTPAVAYTIGDLSLGVGLVVGYSTLALNSNAGSGQTTTPAQSKVGLGGILGATYTPMENFRVGASFLTKSKFSFTSVFDLQVLTGVPDGNLNDITFEEPSEVALGVAYTMGELTMGIDYRRIFWSGAQGFQHLGWADQGVIHAGAQYRMAALTLRGGIVYGKSPIEDRAGINGDVNREFQGVTVLEGPTAQANLIGFTAITEWEVDLGAGYQISENLSVDFSIAYCPTKTVTQSGNTTGVGDFVSSSKANEWAVLGGMNLTL